MIAEHCIAKEPDQDWGETEMRLRLLKLCKISYTFGQQFATKAVQHALQAMDDFIEQKADGFWSYFGGCIYSDDTRQCDCDVFQAAADWLEHLLDVLEDFAVC